MRELIAFLMQNPILLLLVLVWVFSGLASAAKRTQQRKRPTPELEAYRQRHARQAAQRAEARHPAAPPQTADDIARHLREMLGLETVEPPRPRRAIAGSPAEVELTDTADDHPTPFEPHHPEPEAGDDELARGRAGKVGELHEQIVKRHALPTAVTQSVERHIGHAPTRTGPSRRASTAISAFDGRVAAQAVVALEVLGPPRALRPYDSDR